MSAASAHSPEAAEETPTCQACRAPLERTLIDLGDQPLANSYIPLDKADAPEPVFPLHARVCDNCLLVQIDRVAAPDEIFEADYAYFSSYSESWVEHCRRYADAMTRAVRPGRQAARSSRSPATTATCCNTSSTKAIPVLGIEPAADVAAAARSEGRADRASPSSALETATRLASRGLHADLIAANNVLAHVPDINDFVAGFRCCSSPRACSPSSFPHLLRLIEGIQFDTIYHEHFSYLSLLAVRRIFAAHGLRVFDVEQLTTHGGSLRVFACQDRARAIRSRTASRR